MISIITTILVLLLWAPVGATDLVEILLWEDSYVASPQIHLGQIGEITGPEELVSELQGVVIGQAPGPGRSRIIPRGHIEMRIRQRGVSTRQVEISGEEVRVWGGFPPEEEKKTTVVVASREIPRLAIIEGDWVELETLPESQIPPGALVDLEQVVNKRSLRRISPGTPITQGMVERPPLVSRNQEVTILVRLKGITVTAPGLTRTEGGLDEIIPVLNLVTNRLMDARVVDGQTVMVE